VARALADRGEKHSRSFKRFSEAKAFEREVERQADYGTPFNPRAGDVRFDDFLEHAIAVSKLRPSILAQYRGIFGRHLRKQMGHVKIRDISRRLLRSTCASLRDQGAGEATIHAAHVIVRRTLGVAVDEELILRNPATGMGVSKPAAKDRVFLSPEALKELAAEVPDRYRALILFMGRTGARIGEATALRMENLDLLHGWATIAEAATEVDGKRLLGETKTGRVRRVALSPLLRQELEAHVRRYCKGRPSDLVFTTASGDAIRHSNFRNRTFNPAAALIGHPGLTPHGLRHTAVSLAIRAGANPKDVQEMAGHSSIRLTLDTYPHLSEGSQRELGIKTDELFEAKAAPPNDS
jgi:integrase